MRIIIVGMHNKPSLMPLCSSTKTGKLIDRIINKLPPCRTMKTNLYDVEYCPKEWQEKQSLAIDWHHRIDSAESDLIILLGAEVHKNFLNTGLKVLKLTHPGARKLRSHESMNEYVFKAVEEIKEIINKQNK